MNEKKENIDKLEDDFREENSKEILKSYYYKVSLPTLKLTKKEYGIVFHAMNTNYYSKHLNDRYIIEYIDGYIYVAENNGYNEYRIFRRAKIK